MTDPDETLAPDRAEAVWRRAAQLQAEAARRLEERSRALARAGDAAAHPDHFTLEEVRAAAVAAGIDPEFVALAVAEVWEEPGGALTPRQERAALRWLGTGQRRLEVSRTVDLPAPRVFDAMQRVLPGHPWYLSLRDSSGDPLAGGGILVFDVPGVTEALQSPIASHAMTLELRQLRVMLRPAHGPREACEVVVSAGLGRGLRRNTLAARVVTATLGAMGAGGGAALATAAGVAGPLLALPAAAGLALLGGSAALGYGAAYRHSLRRLTEALERLLQAVDVHARTGGAFFPAPRPPAPGAPDGDGGAGATAALIASTTV
jgi:eukaryotic-like serine/threonine-protein kinase